MRYNYTRLNRGKRREKGAFTKPHSVDMRERGVLPGRLRSADPGPVRWSGLYLLRRRTGAIVDPRRSQVDTRRSGFTVESPGGQHLHLRLHRRDDYRSDVHRHDSDRSFGLLRRLSALAILIATMEFFCMGASPPCAYLEVVPDPGAASGRIEVTDCAGQVHYVGGSRFIMNDYGGCGFCFPPATQTSTWGQVKAMYR